MALATTCPYCKISFKVVKDQLKLQRGRVRCGACQRVFPGLDFLVRIPDEPRRPDSARAGAATQPPPDDLKTAFFLPETVMVAPQEERDSEPFAAAATPMGDEDASIVGTTDLDLLAVESGLPQAPHDAGFEPGPFEGGGWPGIDDDSHTRTWDALPLPAAGDADAADSSAMPKAAVAEPAEIAEPAAIAEALVAPQADSSGDAAATAAVSVESISAGSISAGSGPDTQPMPDTVSTPAVADDDGLHSGQGLDDRDMVESIVATTPADLVDVERPPEAAQPTPEQGQRGAGRERVASFDHAAGHDEEESAIDYFSSGPRGVGFVDRHGPLALLGAALLVLALGLQWAIAQRSVIAARAPSLAPAMAALLAPFGLRIELPRDLESLTIESFELQASATRGVLAMSALLRNRADYAVQLPSMQLTLTDPAGRVLVRKALGPGDYRLDTGGSEGLPPHAEWPVRLALEADDLQPAGYSVMLFYP